MDDKIYISWDEFHQDVKTLCAKIKASGNYDKIVAVSRGGLIPAGIAAYELGIRQTAVVNAATYIDGEHKQIESIDGSEQAGATNDKTLIIDGLADSGQTLRLLRQCFPQAKSAVVYVKPKGSSTADFFARALQDKWGVFPWDER